MFSNDILNDRIVTKAVTEKTVINLNLNFKIFVQRQVWVMGFQELCLLCYETQWLRHSQVVRVAQSLVWPPAPFEMRMYQISRN